AQGTRSLVCPRRSSIRALAFARGRAFLGAFIGARAIGLASRRGLGDAEIALQFAAELIEEEPLEVRGRLGEVDDDAHRRTTVLLDADDLDAALGAVSCALVVEEEEADVAVLVGDAEALVDADEPDGRGPDLLVVEGDDVEGSRRRDRRRDEEREREPDRDPAHAATLGRSRAVRPINGGAVEMW